MSKPAVQGGPDGTAADTRAPTEAELDELRSLLLTPEQERLARLQERLDDPRRYAEDISRVLPDAVLLRPAGDPKLTGALMPTVEEALTASVRKNPQAMADAIFPVIFPSIRKAIANIFSQMVQSVNQTLEYSLSWKGLKWRLEALRTGKSFAEVVLSHTLLYRVEQVFLIHKETGLLLQHVTASSVASQDADLVSGMLTAIQDFAHDSFGGQRGDALEEFKYGDLWVWVEQGPKAILAAAIRGSAPQELHQVLQDALDAIHFEQRYALEAFQGDPGPFEFSRVHLEKCLQAQSGDESAGISPKKKGLLIGVAAVLLLGLGFWLFLILRDNWRWDDYLERLESEPGIIVVSAEKRGGKYYVSGLRDPLAADPTTILQATKVSPGDVVSRWEPYQASHRDFILARAQDLLQPPAGVTLDVEGDTLRAEGIAPAAWIAEARRLARALSPISRFDEAGLIDGDRVEKLKQQIEASAIPFAAGSAEIPADQTGVVVTLKTAIEQLRALLRPAGKDCRVEISGHADETGSEMINHRLILDRAEKARSALIAGGLEAASLTTATFSAVRRDTRKASFRVILMESSQQR